MLVDNLIHVYTIYTYSQVEDKSLRTNNHLNNFPVAGALGCAFSACATGSVVYFRKLTRLWKLC